MNLPRIHSIKSPFLSQPLKTPLLPVAYLDEESHRIAFRLPRAEPSPTRGTLEKFTQNIRLLDEMVSQQVICGMESWFAKGSSVMQDAYRPSLWCKKVLQSDGTMSELNVDPLFRPRIGALSTGEQTLGFSEDTTLKPSSLVCCVLGLQGVWMQVSRLLDGSVRLNHFGCKWDVVLLENVEGGLSNCIDYSFKSESESESD